MALSNSVQHTSRIIALVDMDCFYVQVEQRRNPELKGKPCVVVQYKKWRGGGIIAVGYEARKFGVTRQMRGDDAKEKCPDINIVYVKETRGKADLSVYRAAGAEVIKVLASFSDSLERASIDEAYIDLSDAVRRYRMKYTLEEIASKLLQTTHIIGIPMFEHLEKDAAHLEALEVVKQRLMVDSNLNLAVGAIVANEMRDAVLEKTQFTCSAGIAHNKMLAKLVGGMHKPQQQTVVFLDDVPILYQSVKIGKVRHLGGKLGQEIQEKFQIDTMSQLAQVRLGDLKQVFGDKSSEWIFWLAKGIDLEPIRVRTLPQSVGCCKNFRGPESLNKLSMVSFWLSQLSSEVCERLEQEIEVNNRIATHMVVSMKNPGKASVSRSCRISKVDSTQMMTDALRMIREFNRSDSLQKWEPPIVCLGISTSKFEECDNTSNKSIEGFLLQHPQKADLGTKSSESLHQSAGFARDVKVKTDKTRGKPPGLKDFFIRSKSREPEFSSRCKEPVSMAGELESECKEDVTNCSFRGSDVPNATLLSDQGEAGKSDPETVKGSSVQRGSTGPTLLKTCSVLNAEDFAICSKCGKRVLHWEMPEHDDFHFAQDLQHDINKNRNSMPSSKTSPPRKKVKRNSSVMQNFFKPK